MKTLSWNCRGLGNHRAVRALKMLIENQDPDLVFLMETRRKDFEMNRLRGVGYLNNLISVSCGDGGIGSGGGLAVMWKDSVKVDLLSNSKNHMDLRVSLLGDDRVWRLSCIYGYPEQSQKFLTCDLIHQLGSVESDAPWIVCGDFNLVMSVNEKKGGSSPCA